MLKWVLLGFALLAPVFLPGWLRRPVNQNCDWPPDPRSGLLDLNRAADRSHLREDIETAEELAVRFMDAQRDSHGPTESSAAWNRCFVKLSSIISKEHRIAPSQYMSFVGRRPAGFDLAVGISWGLLYAWAASAVAARVWRRQGAAGGGMVMMTYASLAVAAAGVLLGEQWAGLWENFRIGNGHLSYRVDRIPWGHHHLALFLGALAVFWAVAVLRFQSGRLSAERRPGLALT